MRRRVLGSLLFLFAACAPSIIERPEPEPGGPRRARFHRFRVQATAAPVQIRRDLSLADIALLPGAAGSGLKTQGISIIRHSLATQSRFSTATGSKSVLGWFDDVILEIAVSSTVIYIPSDYPPGSCESAIVLEHERGHGRVAREHAALLAVKLERALSTSEGIPTRFDPVISDDYESAAAELKAAVAKVIDPVYERYEKDEREAQEKLDRPDPYDAVYRKCAGWK